MSCLDCPYKLREYDFTNGEYMDTAIWCWKVDGRPKCIGSCGDDLESEENAKRITKKQRIHKYQRYLKHQHHLRYLERVSCGYPPAVTYEDEIRIRRQCYVPNPKPYYKRRYRGHRSKILKQQSNKRIRRYKGELKNGWQCHKIYDFWWEWN